MLVRIQQFSQYYALDINPLIVYNKIVQRGGDPFSTSFNRTLGKIVYNFLYPVEIKNW